MQRDCSNCETINEAITGFEQIWIRYSIMISKKIEGHDWCFLFGNLIERAVISSVTKQVADRGAARDRTIFLDQCGSHVTSATNRHITASYLFSVTCVISKWWLSRNNSTSYVIIRQYTVMVRSCLKESWFIMLFNQRLLSDCRWWHGKIKLGLVSFIKAQLTGQKGGKRVVLFIHSYKDSGIYTYPTRRIPKVIPTRSNDFN